MEMEIKKVLFTRNPSWSSVNPDRWCASVDFASTRGEMSIPLDSEVAEVLLRALTPVLVKFAKQNVESLAEVLTKQLGDKPTLEIPEIPQTSPDATGTES